MIRKRFKSFFLIVILSLSVIIIEEGFMLYSNKIKEKDDKQIALLEDEINTLENNINEKDSELSNLKDDINSITKEIVNIEEKIKNLEELKATIASNTKIIDNIITTNQNPNYPTGCESVALYILLRYYNINISVDDIINDLKKGELPHLEDGKFYGANPEEEFVGNPLSEYSYGVYNYPIRDVASLYKDGVKTETGLDFEKVLKLIDEDRPVIVWATINMIEPYISSTWLDKNNNEVNWIANEHALVVIGYNKDNIVVSDPYTGSIRYYDKDLFISRYNYLGKRAVWY